MKSSGKFSTLLIAAGLFLPLFFASVGVASSNPQVIAWGGSGYGSQAVTNVPDWLSNVVAVSAAENVSMALTSEGKVVAWGGGAYGCTNVPADLSGVVAIAAGMVHCLALTGNGRIVAWGSFSGTNVPPDLTNVVGIAAGALHSLALTADGRAVAWGRNWDGETNVPAELSDVVAISAGGWHNLALKTDGRVVGWGLGAFGATNVPPDLSNVVAVAAGGTDNHLTISVALTSDGLVRSWGDRTDVLMGASNIIAIASGGELDSLGLTAGGLVIPSGPGWWGQSDVPSGLSNVVSISMGYAHTLALVGNTSIFRAGRVMNPQLTAQGFRAEFPTDFGKTYVIERKDSLNDPSWTFIRLLRGTGSTQELVDGTSAASTRFYRVRRMP